MGGKFPKRVVPASQSQQCDAPSNFNSISIMQTIRQYTDTEKEVIKSFFTDVEWDAIDSSLSDYQDYGEEATELMVSISNKMYDLFNPKYQDENRHPKSGAN